MLEGDKYENENIGNVCKLLISTILPITGTVFTGNEDLLLLAITITRNK